MHRVGSINVGQIYSTLDRLQAQGYVVNDGMTGDGLPLYALTPRGQMEVSAWLTEPDLRAGWTDFVGHVLLVASLPDAPAGDLIDAYRRVHAKSHTRSVESLEGPLDELGVRGEEILSSAALAWLAEVQDVLAHVDCARPLGSFRPRRGRRPRHEDI